MNLIFVIVLVIWPLVTADVLPIPLGDEAASPTPYIEKFSDKIRNVSCSSYGEGAFVFGCSDEYFVCRAFGSVYLKYLMHCPYGIHGQRLMMNPKNDQCDYPYRINVCVQAIDSTNATKIFRKKPFSCRNRTDGYYAMDSCSHEYAQCIGGYLHVHLCPTPYEFYDLRTGTCEYKSKCPKTSPDATNASNSQSQDAEQVN
ncbi:hypothetical protein QR680_000662 [Steinernema hermaphroditum]|uniref:Chitin-binding type-2 domain-containing protein n=1 Tax=Steinernema hermaphroditum TaxID=289476 RepID=A0AA39LEJ7_9BILA|nr:hypothetical protein QR680_000662 [Steinernema hermaphroditum]